MPSSAELFRQRLKEALDERGAAAELSRKSGIARSLIDKWARGDSSPGLDSLDRLAEALRVPLWKLLKDPDAADPYVRIPRDLLEGLALAEPEQLDLFRGQLAMFARNRELEALALGRSTKVPKSVPEGAQAKKQRRKQRQ